SRPAGVTTPQVRTTTPFGSRNTAHSQHLAQKLFASASPDA
ncbi:MAG: hypothetical protein ACI835_004960, partial [Planctomycetota bacterium]